MTIQDQAAAAFQQGRKQEAERLSRQLLAARPDDWLAHTILGLIRQEEGRNDDALVHLGQALAGRPQDGMLWFNRGNVHFAQGGLEHALADYDRSLTLGPGFAPAWNNRANVLRSLGRLPEAVADLDQVLRLDPGVLPVLQNRAEIHWQLGRFAEALADVEIILQHQPGDAGAWSMRAGLLRALGRMDEALASQAQAAECAPGDAATWMDWANMLWLERSDLAPAREKIERAVALDPTLPYAPGVRAHLKQQACDWRGLDVLKAELDTGVRAGRPVVEPFVYLAFSASPADLRTCAEHFVRHQYPAAEPMARPARPSNRKIRLGYICGEFYDQATAHLTAGLYERHDRSRFEVIAFDNGPDDGSPMRRRLLAAFDGHVDITRLAGRAAATRMAAEGIDILVSLNGLFGRHRTDALAHRPAPLQVSYLGFPGTMGADYIDYVIADRVVIPDGEQRFYSEQVVWLPHSYQVNDAARIVATPPSREECGLPQGLVFCNFNHAWKHTPDMFALWLRLLAAVEGSVLWLLQSNDVAPDNLRRVAAEAGIAPERLVFAPVVPAAQNLARLALADLGLDGLPVGAHTGASDMLWAGTPLLTCRGSAFSGRVAASLLAALDLPELVTQTLADYEALALQLAHEPQRLKALRAKLALNRNTAPLFDTAATTRALEAAYARMWEQHRRGEAPRGFAV